MKTVWVVNPSGRVVQVNETAPEVGLATNNVNGWSLAKPPSEKKGKGADKAPKPADG